MKTLAILFALSAIARAGDTYDCINAKGDYINYGPAVITHDRIVIAHDSRASSQRWQPMLDPDDYRRLIFLQARQLRREHTAVVYRGF